MLGWSRLAFGVDRLDYRLFSLRNLGCAGWRDGFGIGIPVFAGIARCWILGAEMEI